MERIWAKPINDRIRPPIRTHFLQDASYGAVRSHASWHIGPFRRAGTTPSKTFLILGACIAAVGIAEMVNGICSI